MSTQSFLDEFVKRINIETNYSLVEYKQIINEAYNASVQQKKLEAKAAKEAAKSAKAAKTANTDKPAKKHQKRERDANGEIIKKRPASAYNIFIKEKSAIIKLTNPDVDSKTIFKMAVAEWKKLKESTNDEPVDVHAQESADQPAQESADQPAQESADQPVKDTNDVADTSAPCSITREISKLVEDDEQPKKPAKKLAKKTKKIQNDDE